MFSLLYDRGRYSACFSSPNQNTGKKGAKTSDKSIFVQNVTFYETYSYSSID